MGLFSRKKKMTKVQRDELERARDELQKLKEKHEQSNQEDLNRSFEKRKQNLESKSNEHTKEMDAFHVKVESELQAKQKEFNDEASNFQSNSSTQENLENNKQSCLVPDCNVQVDFFSGKKCKWCKNLYCFEHIQLEKHECVKTTPTKFLRKTWLRRYNLNISSGKYIVVCDDCGYVSGYSSLIDIAGDERKYHIDNNSCNSKQVFLEEDLSDQKVEKNIDLEKVVPTDRGFWVCSHCRPAQKFTDRAQYIAHHFSHG